MHEKATDSGIFPKRVNRGEMVSRESIDDLAPAVEKNRIGSDQNGFGMRLRELEQCRVEFVYSSNLKNIE